MTKNQQDNSEPKKEEAAEKKPNEFGGFYFASHLKISDPNTNEVLVQIRGDN